MNAQFSKLFQMVGVCVAFAAMILLILAVSGAGYRQWTAKQEEVHEAAEDLRALGYEETSAAIEALQIAWRNEEQYMVWIEDDVTENVTENVTDTGTEIGTNIGTEARTEPDLAAMEPWEAFNYLHPGYNLTSADFWTMGHMLEVEAGNCPRYIQLLVGMACKNRVLYHYDCPNTVTGTVAQPGQYNPAYVSYYDSGFSQDATDAADWLFRDATDIIPAEYMPDGADLPVPHSLRYHGNFLTGGWLWRQYSDSTWGGYHFTLYFGCSDSTCTG